MKRDEVTSRLKSQNQRLTKQYGIKAIYLFGSVAGDEADENSDLDLFVEFKNPIRLFEFIETKIGNKTELYS